jgi:hypothetical protein
MIEFVTIKLITTDQCIHTIMKLNNENAIEGFAKKIRIGRVLPVTTNFFCSLFSPINNKGGTTKARTRCSAEWTEKRYLSPIS